jgi:hypothetical protein
MENKMPKKNRKIERLLATLLAAALLAGSFPVPHAALAQSGDPVLVGAGDIAQCDNTKDEATAKLLDGIGGTVFTAGDNAYPAGSLTQFRTCYGSSWERHKSRTRPAAGNHEYNTSGAAGYYTYFGKAASPLESSCTSNCKGYYSYNLGDWHIVVLNTTINHAAGSAQEKWLRSDLANNKRACTLAIWHHPRFSSGKHGSDSTVGVLWQDLYAAGADVVINGHDHMYERFALQNPSGKADTRGIRQFTVGTGGATLYPLSTVKANSQVRDNKTFGVLKLTLHASSYDWKFVPIGRQSFTDSGKASCVNPA